MVVDLEYSITFTKNFSVLTQMKVNREQAEDILCNPIMGMSLEYVLETLDNTQDIFCKRMSCGKVIHWEQRIKGTVSVPL